MAKKSAKKKSPSARKPAAKARAKRETAPVDPIAEALRRRRAALLAR
jgi:hypothetical protein